MDPAIEIHGLRKSFGSTVVLDDLDLVVERGTVFALLGPNGAGKTTLINILSTLVRPDAGTAVVNGFDVGHAPQSVRRSIALTGQSAAVDGMLSGDENLRMMGRLSGLTRRDAARRAKDLLAAFELSGSARKLTKSYSGGMRRRLDLAISLIVRPPVVFLDEPTTGLDTRSRQELWDVIRGLRDDGTTVLLTTQYLEEADRLADRIAVLDHGRIVAEGTAAELKARTGGEVVEVHGPDGDVIVEQPTDGTVDGLARVIEELRASHGAAPVTVRKPTLDDAFLVLTGSHTDTKEDA